MIRKAGIDNICQAARNNAEALIQEMALVIAGIVNQIIFVARTPYQTAKFQAVAAANGYIADESPS